MLEGVYLQGGYKVGVFTSPHLQHINERIRIGGEDITDTELDVWSQSGWNPLLHSVMQRKGKFGLGIFPIDSSKPIDLFVPLELLVPKDNIELRDEQVAIKDDQNFPEGYSDWFLKYQKNYSWGAEGKESTLSFEKGLKALPENIQNMLQSYGLYNPEVRFPEEDINEEILKRFSRIEVTGDPMRVRSNFVRGYSKLMVKLTPKR